MGQPLRVRAPTPEENPKLASMAASKDFTGRIRASIVLESSEGARVGKIASKLRLNKHTVRLWIKRFNESGLDGLRPPSITNGQKDEIVRTALTDPRRLGMSLTTWSLPALRSYLEGKGTVKSISE